MTIASIFPCDNLVYLFYELKVHVNYLRGKVLRVLIAQQNTELGTLWAGFLEREGIQTTLVSSQEQALATLRTHKFDALVLEMVLPDGGAIAIADFAAYRMPDVPVITVNSSSFFSDGSIFQLLPNVHSVMQAPVEGEDLAAMVSYLQNRYNRSPSTP